MHQGTELVTLIPSLDPRSSKDSMRSHEGSDARENKTPGLRLDEGSFQMNHTNSFTLS